MAKVGTAYIEIKPDMTGFAQELRRRLDAIKAEKKVKVVIDSRSLRNSLREGLGGIEDDIEGAIGRGGDKADAAAKKAGAKSGDSFGKQFSKRMTSNLRFGGFIGKLVAVGSVMIGPLIGILNSLAGAALAVGSALGAAAIGGAAAFAGALGALGQAALAAKLAMAGMGDAMKAQSTILDKQRAGVEVSEGDLDNLAVAMAKLSPAAQGVVKSLGGLSGQLLTMRKAMQESLFAGFPDIITNIGKTVLPTLQTELVATAGVLNTTGKSFGTFVAQASTVGRLKTIMANNTGALAVMGQAVVPATNALLILGTAIKPLTDLAAQWVRNWAQAASANLELAESSGKLAGFINLIKFNLEKLMSIAGNVGGIIAGLFSASVVTGGDMLGMLDRVTAKWEGWVKSAEGQSKIADFARDAIPVMHELGGLIGDIKNMFVDLGKGADSAGFIASIRNILGPLSELLGQLSNPNTGGQMADGLASIGQALVDMNAGGILRDTITSVADLLKLIASIVTSVPGGTQVLGSLVAVIAGWQAMKFVATASGITKIPEMIDDFKNAKQAVTNFKEGFQGVEGATGKMAPVGAAVKKLGTGMADLGKKAALAALDMGKFLAQQAVLGIKLAATTLAMLAQKTAAMAVAAAQKAWTVIQWLLNAAMSANPIGIILIAIIALIAGIILAYQHSETFRKIVDAALKAVAAAFKWLWDVISPVLASIWEIVKAVFEGIWEAIKLYWNYIEALIKAGVATVLAIWNGLGSIWDFIKGLWDKVTDAFAGAWRFIKDSVSNGVRSVLDLFRGLPGDIVGALSGLAGMLSKVGVDLVTGLWNGIKGMSKWLMDKVLGFAKEVIPGPLLKFFGIESPSKLMAEIGKDVTLGLAVGMESSGQAVKDEANNLAKLAVPTIPTPVYPPLTLPTGLGSQLGREMALSLRVFIGDTELKDLVRVELGDYDADAAYSLIQGRRGGF